MSTAAFAMAGCVDTDIDGIDVEKPGSLAKVEYLNDYSELKSYIDRSLHPGFKLGAGVSAQGFIDQSIEYRVACANFDEVTAGNAMKYASCVADDGTMDFSTVANFVSRAKEDGITIYGHTLAWHSQQNITYLSSLIANKEIEVDPDAKEEIQDNITDFSTMTSFPFYVMGYTPDIVDGVLKSSYPGEWYQYFVMSDFPTVPGREYKVTAYIRASKEGSFNVQMGNWGATNEKAMTVSEDWEEQSVTFTTISTETSFVVFQPGTFDGDIELQWVKVTHSEAPSVEIYVDQVNNGSMQAGESMSSFIVRESGKSDVEGTVLEGQGPDGKNCIAIQSVANPTNTYDTQFFIVANKTWAAGEQYKISFWYKATENAACETQCHGEPGSYLYWQMLPSNPSFTTEWQYYEATSTIPESGDGMKSIAFNLNVNTNAVTYYFADIAWQSVEKGNTIPLTDEEKKDTLTWAMDNWIGGMMEACGGYVTAWDVVNEAISGGNPDSEGVFALQHSDGYNSGGTWDVGGDAFYWQDYMGDLDYVRTAVALARKHFEASGGTPADLKLFINDYNLESDWDNNGKVKSLVKWIARWEADGVTKIDGIGTQMHVSCYANESTMQSKKDHIEEMFNILAQSGKLVKISELDMGYIDADGNTVNTADITEEQHKEMAEYYKFIITKFFEIIPVAQQYGITQWALTDSPAGSGWRANEPIGLWDADYYRKHTYAGFADGLQGGSGK